ncbi:MAG: DinB family protein [Bacteroidota bacterium]
MSEWSQQIHSLSEWANQAFRFLTPDELNWRPDSSTWSIAQNLEHLITVNETYYPVIEVVRRGRYRVPFLGRIGFLNRAMGNTVYRSVTPSQKRKTRTFPIWEPSQSTINGDILDRFLQHQEELATFIDSCADLVDQKQIISSPANRNIVYPLSSAFDIIVAHEQRHLEAADLIRIQILQAVS